jgi:hypothetical protein
MSSISIGMCSSSEEYQDAEFSGAGMFKSATSTVAG